MKSPNSRLLARHQLLLASGRPFRRKVHTGERWFPLLVSAVSSSPRYPGIALASEVPVIRDPPGRKRGKKKKKIVRHICFKKKKKNKLTRQVKQLKKVIWQCLGWAEKIIRHLIFLLIEMSNFSVFFFFFFTLFFWSMREGSLLMRRGSGHSPT